jgi:hypothetical protein
MSAPERLLTDLNPVCRIPLRIESDACKLNITGWFPNTGFKRAATGAGPLTGVSLQPVVFLRVEATPN